MATRLKTVEYCIPTLTTLTDNTLTAMANKDVYIPEFASTVTFKSVTLNVSLGEAAGVTPGNVTSRRIDVRLNGGTATTYTNNNTHTGSGEQQSFHYILNITNHFNTYWTTGTSKTLGINVLYNHSIGNMVNVNATVQITYEYDDTVATQVKTVRIPLNNTTGALGTTKDTAKDTIPALDTYLPEASKVYRDAWITVQGNTGIASTADLDLDFQIDTLTQYTTQLEEGAGNSQSWARYNYTDTSSLLSLAGFVTSATQEFYLWGGQASHHHAQIWMTVTYEFDATSSNDMMVSLILPCEIESPLGGITSSDYQRGSRQLWIQEPGTLTLSRMAYYAFWDQAAPIAGLNWRVGTGSFISYTDAAATLCGGNGCMVRNDSAFSGLVKGINTFTVDAYRTDTADLGFNVGGFFLVNYTCGKPTQGYGAANKTIFYNIIDMSGAAATVREQSNVTIPIPESSFYLNALGTNLQYVSNSTTNPAGVTTIFEQTSAEGGVMWHSAYVDIGHTDPESGLRQCWSQSRDGFNRWPNDPDSSRFELSTPRRWRNVYGNAATNFDSLDIIYTYHTISYTLSSTISNSNGGTVTLDLHRKLNGSDEKVAQKTRTGNGIVAWEWYDDTESMFVVAREDDTLVGRSGDFTF